MKNVITFLVTLLLGGSLQAQEVKIERNDFQNHLGFNYNLRYNFSGNPNEELSGFKLPSNISSIYTVKNIIFQADQYLFEKYKRVELAETTYLEIKKSFDTSKLVDKSLKNYLSVLVYTDEAKKYLIFDRNYNKDFTDDETFEHKLSEIENVPNDTQFTHALRITVPTEYSYAGKVMSIPTSIFLLPYAPVSIRIIQKENLNFSYTIPDITRIYSIKDINFVIRKMLPDTAKNYVVSLIGEDGKRSNKNYASKDKFSFRGQTFMIDTIDLNRNAVKITQLKELVTKGTQLNFYFDGKIFGPNQNHSFVSLDKYKGKYLLIDVWATWCVPCVESIPVLQELHNKYKGGMFSILSVSIDKETDRDKVKKFVKAHGMTWDVLLPKTSNSKETERFASSVPYFLLLDPNGKIIFSESGTASLIALKRKIEEQIADKNGVH
ncbi:MAG: TlpA family protein disulfide reductase [Bacteroidia bacterium]